MRTRTLFAAACFLSVSAAAQTTAAPPKGDASPAVQTLSVNASLVVVPVTVRDKKDHFVRTLTRDDFTLTVDGKTQNIRYFDREDDLPLTVGLLVDVSGSQRTVLDAERTASSAFLDGMLQPGRDRAFVVQFGHTADLLADITPSVPKLQAALQKIDADTDRPSFSNGGSSDPQDTSQNGGNTQDQGNGSGSGNNGGYGGRRSGGGRSTSSGRSNGAGTVLYDAVYLSSDEVLKKAPSKDGQTRKAVILLTDGDDRGSKESLPSAIEAAQRTDTTIYAIYYKGEEQHDRGFGGGGFPGGRGGGFPGGGGRGGGGYPGGGGGGRGGESRVDGKKILERMADETGGRVYEVTKKMPLTEIYRQIAEELRSQYRLGFTPNNADAGYHKLIVDTPKDKKLILQARDGYYTGGQSK